MGGGIESALLWGVCKLGRHGGWRVFQFQEDGWYLWRRLWPGIFFFYIFCCCNLTFNLLCFSCMVFHVLLLLLICIINFYDFVVGFWELGIVRFYSNWVFVARMINLWVWPRSHYNIYNTGLVLNPRANRCFWFFVCLIFFFFLLFKPWISICYEHMYSLFLFLCFSLDMVYLSLDSVCVCVCVISKVLFTHTLVRRESPLC